MNIRELAGAIGVSPSTVSIVLNNREGVSEKTRKRVQEAIRQYDYSPAFRSGPKKGTVLVLLYRNSGSLIEENEGFISSILEAVEERASSKQWKIERKIIRSDLETGIRELSLSQYLGVILVSSEITMESFGAISQISIPMVSLDNALPGCNFPAVVMNNLENVALALDYLKKCGHSKIGYFRSSAMFVNFLERTDAFYRYVKEYGMEFLPENEIRVRPAMQNAAEDVKVALRGRKSLPTCFFADNDSIALGAIRALKDMGFRIPDDISIIGFDDIPFAAVSSPALTTVRVQRDILGKLTVDTLEDLLDDQEYRSVKHRVTGYLVERRSVSKIS